MYESTFRTQSLFTFAFAVEQTQSRSQSEIKSPKTLTNNDVVDALPFMQQGSELILIENDDYTPFSAYYLTPDGTSVVDEDDNVVFPLAAVESVDMACETTIQNAIEVLQIPEMRVEGLEPILFSVTMLGGHTTTVIADTPRNSFIWMRGLQALISSTNELSAIALMVSNRLRSGTLIISNPNILPDDEEETVESAMENDRKEDTFTTKHNVVIPIGLAEEWQYFEREIASIDHFVQVFCILDSTQHLAMLSDVLHLRNRLYDLESRIHEKNESSERFLSWCEWPNIHVQWWTLHADLVVTKLRTLELSEELGLKR